LKHYSIFTKLAMVLICLLLIAAIYGLFIHKKELPASAPITVQEKKQRFKSLIVPAINKVYSNLMQQYQEVSGMVGAGDPVKGLDKEELDKLAKLRAHYRVDNNQDLLSALKPHPRSIAVAQAAMESAWATSRFFREANNVFGVWSFDKNEARIAAGQKRGDKTIWVKKYPSVEASIRDYYRTLGRGDAFQHFRALKMHTNDPHSLVTKLDRYSEKGAEYGKELSAIIKFNKFDLYDVQ
jgi:Bax protein